MHGLVNRMRAYCSASAYAQQTGRGLLVVWEPDVHTQTKLTDLFDLPAGVQVISSSRAGLRTQAVGFSEEVDDKSVPLIRSRSAYN